jgi:mono/diheme cytochrome c family protein
MKSSSRIKATSTLLIFGFAAVIGGVGETARLAFAQNSGEGSRTEGKAEDKEAGKKDTARELTLDDYQRSAQVLYMLRMGKSGSDRGQEIYYMKCWICHNDYTRKVDPKAAPTLKGLFTRAKLISGPAVNDETVTTQIREGSANMPSYKWVLGDKDLADLMTYLREKCCWDENNPPANPRYRAQ